VVEDYYYNRRGMKSDGGGVRELNFAVEEWFVEVIRR